MKAASSAFGKPREVICFTGLFCICKKTKNFSSEPSREAVDAACFATIAVHINGRLFIGRPVNMGENHVGCRIYRPFGVGQNHTD